jgi:hypothetical protein
MSYKDFSSFFEIKPAFGENTEPNHGFTARPAFPCAQHEHFTDDYFLLYRRSEYAAQVELVCAKIFTLLMGYGPQMEIVLENNKFYIASRRIKNFKEGYPDFSDEAQYEDITGLAATRIIYYFLCGTDNHSGNFGTQQTDTGRLSFRIDMAEAFDFSMFKTEWDLNSLEKIPYIVEEHFEGDDPLFLPRDYVLSPRFQKEKQDIISKIAETPFELFEALIRETITTDHYTHLKAMNDFIISYFGYTGKKADKIMQRFSEINPLDHTLDVLINLFKERHQKWHLLVLNNPIITQDLSLSDHTLFYAEINKYHCNTDAEKFSPQPGPSNPCASVSTSSSIDRSVPSLLTYDEPHYFSIFSDPQFFKKDHEYFSSDILGSPYAAVQLTEAGMKWLAGYYAKKYNMNILTSFIEDFDVNESYTSTVTRYDFILEHILQLRKTTTYAKIGFVLFAGSHACAIIYEKNNEEERIYQFDSQGLDGPFESITSAILTEKYYDQFSKIQVYVSVDPFQIDISSCHLFSFFIIKELLKTEILPLLRNVNLADEVKYHQQQRKVFPYYQCNIPAICLKVAQNKRCITADVTDTEVKPGESLASYRERYTLSITLNSPLGNVHENQRINKRIYDYGLTVRSRARLFFKADESLSNNSASSSMHAITAERPTLKR